MKKAMIGLRERYNVDVDGGPDLKVHGNIVDHEYEIEIDDGPKIGEVSKKWFRLRDSYGVDVFDPDYTVLVLAVAVAVDSDEPRLIATGALGPPTAHGARGPSRRPR